MARFSDRFYRAAAVCSIVSAATTLGLIFLPRLYQPVPDFDARMALVNDPAYVARAWIYMVHPFLVVTAALAVGARCLERAAGAAVLGFLGFALWAAVEAGQQALTLAWLDRVLRPAWPAADSAARAAIRQQVAVYDALWDAAYLLLLIAFLLGNLLLGVAVRRAGPGLARWVGAAYFAAAGLTLLILVPELGGPGLGPAAGWLYPVIQPAGRVLVGFWLLEPRHSPP